MVKATVDDDGDGDNDDGKYDDETTKTTMTKVNNNETGNY